MHRDPIVSILSRPYREIHDPVFSVARARVASAILLIEIRSFVLLLCRTVSMTTVSVLVNGDTVVSFLLRIVI